MFMVRIGFETMIYGPSKVGLSQSPLPQVVRGNSKHVQCLWKGLSVWIQPPEKDDSLFMVL